MAILQMFPLRAVEFDVMGICLVLRVERNVPLMMALGAAQGSRSPRFPGVPQRSNSQSLCLP